MDQEKADLRIAEVASWGDHMFGFLMVTRGLPSSEDRKIVLACSHPLQKYRILLRQKIQENILNITTEKDCNQTT